MLSCIAPAAFRSPSLSLCWGMKPSSMMQVDSMTHYQMGARESMVAMLQGAALPGVGPVTATRLASHFGKDLPAIMDSPDAAARICSVKGIGAKTSKAIKEAWDNTKGEHSEDGHVTFNQVSLYIIHILGQYFSHLTQASSNSGFAEFYFQGHGMCCRQERGCCLSSESRSPGPGRAAHTGSSRRPSQGGCQQGPLLCPEKHQGHQSKVGQASQPASQKISPYHPHSCMLMLVLGGLDPLTDSCCLDIMLFASKIRVLSCVASPQWRNISDFVLLETGLQVIWCPITWPICMLLLADLALAWLQDC